MLKIALITEHFPSSIAPAAGRLAYQTLKVLSRTCDLQVFYPYAEYPSFVTLGLNSKKRLDPTFCLPGVNVKYYSYRAFPLISRPFNGSQSARAVLTPVRDFVPDLILSYFLYPSGYAALEVGKALSVPVVVVGVGSDIHHIADPFSRMHTRKVLRESDLLVTVSEDLRRRALKLGARLESSRTIINGCDLSVFHPRDRREARRRLGINLDSETIVYVGRLDLRKGLQELVEASLALHCERADVHTYLVGDGPDKSLIETAIRENGAGEYVHLVPECSFDDVALWMAAADVSTLPSYMEGCPNTVLEALACGRPVVATNVGGIPEIMNDECGRLIPPRDPGALVEALASVLNEEWDCVAISSHWGRSWESCSDELFQGFESLLSIRPTARKNK